MLPVLLCCTSIDHIESANKMDKFPFTATLLQRGCWFFPSAATDLLSRGIGVKNGYSKVVWQLPCVTWNIGMIPYPALGHEHRLDKTDQWVGSSIFWLNVSPYLCLSALKDAFNRRPKNRFIKKFHTVLCAVQERPASARQSLDEWSNPCCSSVQIEVCVFIPCIPVIDKLKEKSLPGKWRPPYAWLSLAFSIHILCHGVGMQIIESERIFVCSWRTLDVSVSRYSQISYCSAGILENYQDTSIFRMSVRGQTLLTQHVIKLIFIRKLCSQRTKNDYQDGKSFYTSSIRKLNESDWTV